MLEVGVLWGRFRRLFEPSEDRNVLVATMGMEGWEVDGLGLRGEKKTICLGRGTIGRLC